MTMATTVLGLVPLALGFGEGAELRQPMAIVVIAGLASSTLLTLVVIPVVYSLFSRSGPDQRGGRVNEPTALDRAVRWTLLHRVTVFVLARDGRRRRRHRDPAAPPRAPPPRPREATTSASTVPVNAANPIEVQESIVRPDRGAPPHDPGYQEARVVGRARRGADQPRVLAGRRPRPRDGGGARPDRARAARRGRPRCAATASDGSTSTPTCPILQFGIEVAQPSDELSFLVEERIVKPLEAIPGVARVQCMRPPRRPGPHLRRPRSARSPPACNLYELTRALEAGNVDTSGGEIEEGGDPVHGQEHGPVPEHRGDPDFPVRPGLKLGQIATIEPPEDGPRLARAVAHDADALVPRPEGVLGEHGRDVHPGSRGAPAAASRPIPG